MSTRNLDKLFDPKSIAVIGASNKKGSVGYILLRNLIGAEYEGVVYPVNVSAQSVQGIQAYASIGQVPRKIDLVVIAVPAKAVPATMRECGEAGVAGAVIVSSGFKEIGKEGIKSTALCPAFVDTPMTDFVKEHVPAEEMIRPEDIAESVRFLLRVSPACVVPEIMFVRPGEAL